MLPIIFPCALVLFVLFCLFVDFYMCVNKSSSHDNQLSNSWILLHIRSILYIIPSHVLMTVIQRVYDIAH